MKNIFKLLIAVLVLSFTACSTAPNAGSLKPNEKQMLGLWEEYSPGSNCVEFSADHTMKIYLTEEEGRQTAGSHYIEATWGMDEKNVLTLMIAMGEKSFNQSVPVVFEKGEMWMKEKGGGTTKHRHVTEVPARFKW